MPEWQYRIPTSTGEVNWITDASATSLAGDSSTGIQKRNLTPNYPRSYDTLPSSSQSASNNYARIYGTKDTITHLSSVEAYSGVGTCAHCSDQCTGLYYFWFGSFSILCIEIVVEGSLNLPGTLRRRAREQRFPLFAIKLACHKEEAPR